MTGPTVLLADERLLLGPFGVLRVAAEVDPDKGLVADHPGVVAGTDRGEVAGADVALRAVVHHDMHLSADRVDQVGRLAAIRAGDRLHVLRPAPAGLPRARHRRVVADLHDLHFALTRQRALLVGPLRALDLDTRHGPLLVVVSD